MHRDRNAGGRADCLSDETVLDYTVTGQRLRVCRGCATALCALAWLDASGA
jgi:hypothetical protein